jgi:uncharacterized protein
VFDLVVGGSRLREWYGDPPDVTRLTDAAVQVRAERVDRLVTLRGQARLVVGFICARCGDERETELQLPFRMVLSPRRGADYDEDEETGYYAGDEIELDRVVAEQVALAMPNSFLCRPDCRGLCPVCRANLNDGPCSCGASRTE